MTYTVPLYVGRMLGQTEFNEPKRHRKSTFLAADKALKATFSSAPSVKEKPLRRTQSLGKKKKKKRWKSWEYEHGKIKVPGFLQTLHSKIHTLFTNVQDFFFHTSTTKLDRLLTFNSAHDTSTLFTSQNTLFALQVRCQSIDTSWK